MDRSAKLSLALVVAIAVGEVFRSYLPPIWELRDAPGTRDDATLRGAEAHAIGYAVIIGMVVSAAARSAWPLIGAMATSGLMFAQYEWAIQPDGAGAPLG